MDTGDHPNSICHIQSIHMYTLQSTDFHKPVPFALLAGETILHFGSSVDGLIIISNYRLYLQNGENQYHIPLGLIESTEIRELFHLHLFCKDARTYRCTFENNESALDWYDRVTKTTEPPRQIEQTFAFYHCVWAKEQGGDKAVTKAAYQRRFAFDKEMFENEMLRMQFQGDSWRISKGNENYKICPTYPPYLLVPSCINDEMLESVAKFRSSRRIPVAVWRHTRNGAIIARCSQPEVGWFGWRSSEDEDLLKAISDACNFDRNLRANSSSDTDSVLSHSPGSLHSEESLQITGEVIQQEKKLLIIDARSYTTAVANRARGGGCECPEYYPNCEIQFMNLANIHSIRKSFHALRQLCMSSADQPNWFSLLENTRWLSHMSGLMKAAVILSTAVERDGRPVLVHCSDGWDRTPQIVALAELLLDPYYRTTDGFRVLIEREWLAFGHKFADRCGHSGGSEDLNERCPVFLQWLDCVHQLITQFPVSFEFSHNFLIKLALHTYSNLFGTFLCNTQKQRSKVVHGRTFSVWEFLSTPSFKNQLYSPVQSTAFAGKVLWPKTNIRDLRLWSEVYLGSMESNFNREEGSGGACPGPPQLNGYINMSKTRSYGDLINAESWHGVYGGRRSSDPSINREMKLVPRENCKTAITINHDNSREQIHIECGQDNVPDFVPSDMEDNPADCIQDGIFSLNATSTPNLTDDQIDGLSFDSEDTQPDENPQCEKVETEPAIVAVDNTGHILANGIDNVIPKDDIFFINQSDSTDESETASTGSKRGSKAEIIDLDTNDKGFLENNNNSPTSQSVQGSYNGYAADIENAFCNAGERVCKVLDLEKSVETSTETLVSDHLIIGPAPNSHCHTHGYRELNSCHLGEDGLIPVRSPVQERLDQIIEEHRQKIELLEKELHASRQILIKQACHKCQNDDGDRHDDNGSVVESLNSTSDGQASAGGSLRSDMSWVDVEEGIVAECQGTLWVPDHAVNRCTGCGTEFWLGRRRHHCRKCGRIFCADCSEHATPLPAEQLYNPVRVCTECYSDLRRLQRPLVRNSRSESPSSSCKKETPGPQGCQRIHTQTTAANN